MCTVILPLGDNAVAVNKYIISQVLGASCPWLPSFVCWPSRFLGPQYRMCFNSSLWHPKFWDCF